MKGVYVIMNETNANIIHKVQEVVKKAGTRDPEEICNAYDFSLRYHDLGRRIKAYYIYMLRRHNIVIDSNINKAYIRVLIAHELGHCFLHRNLRELNSFQETDIFKTSKSDYTEYEANLFAAELLLEDHEVWEELMLSDLTYPQIAMKLGVPVSLMEFKLVMLKSKGYIMTDLPTTKNDFLKYESYAYDNWYAD
jgi:Zn-dependent peptidase ImmA (M78 family)